MRTTISGDHSGPAKDNNKELMEGAEPKKGQKNCESAPAESAAESSRKAPRGCWLKEGATMQNSQGVQEYVDMPVAGAPGIESSRAYLLPSRNSNQERGPGCA